MKSVKETTQWDKYFMLTVVFNDSNKNMLIHSCSCPLISQKYSSHTCFCFSAHLSTSIHNFSSLKWDRIEPQAFVIWFQVGLNWSCKIGCYMPMLYFISIGSAHPSRVKSEVPAFYIKSGLL